MSWKQRVGLLCPRSAALAPALPKSIICFISTIFFFLFSKTAQNLPFTLPPPPLLRKMVSFQRWSAQKVTILLIACCRFLIYSKSCTVCKVVVTWFLFLISRPLTAGTWGKMKWIISERCKATGVGLTRKFCKTENKTVEAWAHILQWRCKIREVFIYWKTGRGERHFLCTRLNSYRCHASPLHAEVSAPHQRGPARSGRFYWRCKAQCSSVDRLRCPSGKSHPCWSCHLKPNLTFCHCWSRRHPSVSLGKGRLGGSSRRLVQDLHPQWKAGSWES